MMSAEKISIHAPTRGATSYGCKPDDGYAISIHAPTRGATLPLCLIFISSGDFNPRSHKGSDLCRLRISMPIQIFQSTLPQGERQASRAVQYLSSVISIHAPTRGATRSFKAKGFNIKISIHAPTRGATLSMPTHSISHKFQSTLPQGERPFASTIPSICPSFQSTLPQGERP